MDGPAVNEDAIVACADLAGRAGARDFEIGYMHDGVPVELAGWYAQVTYLGARIMTDEHPSPSLAAMQMAERLLGGATCKCRRTVTLSGAPAGEAAVCRWRLVGRRWEPGCTAPSVHYSGPRGDHEAMRRALAAGAEG